MTYQPLFVGPLQEGLRKDLQPFMLPEEAFPTLENAYEFRGVIYKKGGNKLIGRLGIREQVLVAARGAGNTAVNLSLSWTTIEPGSIIISDGTTIFTDDGIGGFTITGGTGSVNAPTNYNTGAINITFTTANPGAAITALYYMFVDDDSIVMGLRRLELENSVKTELMAFDRVMSYKYSDNNQRFEHIVNYRTVANPVEWTGNDSDFFWTTNYIDAFWATNNVSGGHFYTITGITNAAAAIITIGAHNFVNGDQVFITNVAGMTQINGLTGTVTATAALTITVNINSAAFGVYTGGGIAHSIYKTKAASGDGIRWYDNGTTKGWVNFSPPLSNANVPEILQGALIIVPYHDRLVCFNTVEGTTFANGQRYAQRARWSQNGSPFQGAIVPSNSGMVASSGEWYSSPGKGGFQDAPTQEEIVSVAFIKDTLIVFFERSTWQLIYNSNPAFPFYWQKINNERGSESTFSTIEFDKSALTIGQDGIFGCDSVGVERFDLKIPDQIFDLHNELQGNKRVYGVRDVVHEFVFWTYHLQDSADDLQSPAGFPNRILAYNYRDETWSTFKNNYTVFGTYYTSIDQTWNSMIKNWNDANMPWNAGTLQKSYPIVVGGNTNGFVHEVKDVAQNSYPWTNDFFYVIQNITAGPPSLFTVPNHGLVDGDFVILANIQGGASVLNGIRYKVRAPTTDTFELDDSNGDRVVAAGYTYGGYVKKVDDFEVTTKKFNPVLSLGSKTRVGYIDLFIFNTPPSPIVGHEITLNLYIDEDIITPTVTRTIQTSDLKNINNQKFWTRVYVNQVGQTFQMELTFSDTQMFNGGPGDQEFALYSFIVWASDAGRLTI